MATAGDIDMAIYRLAARTSSVAHGRDMRALGISNDAIRARVVREWMVAIIGRAFGVGPLAAHPTDSMRCMAGLLHAGSGSMLVGLTGAALLGAWERDAPRVQVASRRAVRGGSDEFEFVRLQGRAQADSITVDGFRIMDPAALCLDLAGRLTRYQLANVITNLRYRRHVDLASLARLRRERAGHPNSARLADAIALVGSGSVGTRGRTEDRLLEIMREIGLPEPIVNTRGAMGMPNDEPDFVHQGVRLNTECDGDHHLGPEQVLLDAARDAIAYSLGWRVLRIWWLDVWQRPREVAALMLDTYHAPVPAGPSEHGWSYRSSGLLVPDARAKAG